MAKSQVNPGTSPKNVATQHTNMQDVIVQFEKKPAKIVFQKKLQEVANNSPRVQQLKALQQMADSNPIAIPVVQRANRQSTSMEGTTVQRNKDSAEKLGTLAEPKVGQQDIELASGIQGALEEIYTNIMKIGDMSTMERGYFNSAVCLGGIELPSLHSFDNMEDILNACKFVNLGKGSVNRGIYELLGEELKTNIVLNTLLTMDQAGQLDYLKKSDFAGGEKSAWKVVVEVHYYRERPSTNNFFHKDTLGNTLFVNLNYLNKEKIIGPEFVVKPMDNPTHLKQIAESLPEEFLQDRSSVMEALDEPKIIDVVKVPEYGYVTFVDEMIHHSSPTTEHRKVKGSEIHKYLRDRDADKYNTYKAAYLKYKKWYNLMWDYESYLPDGAGFDAEDWLNVFEDIKDTNAGYDRNAIRKIEPEGRVFSDSDVDELVHLGSYDSFGEASIPKAGGKSKMTANDRPLKRRMSMKLDAPKGLPGKESGGRRSFFRTWVRAEKLDAEVIKPDWKWDQKR